MAAWRRSAQPREGASELGGSGGGKSRPLLLVCPCTKLFIHVSLCGTICKWRSWYLSLRTPCGTTQSALQGRPSCPSGWKGSHRQTATTSLRDKPRSRDPPPQGHIQGLMASGHPGLLDSQGPGWLWGCPGSRGLSCLHPDPTLPLAHFPSSLPTQVPWQRLLLINGASAKSHLTGQPRPPAWDGLLEKLYLEGMHGTVGL